MKKVKNLLIIITIFLFNGCSVMTDTVTVNIGNNCPLLNNIDNLNSKSELEKVSTKSNKEPIIKGFRCIYEVKKSKPSFFSTEENLKAKLECEKKL